MTPAKPWTDEDHERLCQLKAGGGSYGQISAALGRTPDSVRNRWRAFGGNQMSGSASARPPLPEMQQFRQAAERLSGHNPVITGHGSSAVPMWHDPDKNPAELWQHAEQDAERRIEKAKLHSKFTAQLPSDRVAAITFISDQHIAPGTPVDFKRMREDAELIAATRDVYAILGGDGVDNHIKHFAAVLAARSQPSDQWLLFEYYLHILAERLMVVTAGNHDLWTNQYAGLDMVGWLCRQKKFAYAPYEARVNVSLGSQDYRIAVRHQYRLNSSFNQTHSVKQWLRLGEDDFDVGCIGHHHEAAIEQTVYRGKVVWCCRPGAYQVTSAYSQTYGWNSAVPTCPTFLLFPDKRHIIGLHDFRDAPKLLKAFNG
jgi:hypothetical protein